MHVSPDGHAGLSGVQTCGSVWACSVCSEKINAGRQHELQNAIESWQAAGGGVLFGTVTMRHTRGMRLADMLDAIAPAWNRTTSGSSGWNGTKAKKDGTQTDIGDKRRFGIHGVIRLLEVKHGENGWHPHIHFLVFLDRPVSPSQWHPNGLMHPRELLDLQGRLYARWEAALAREGYSVLEHVGIDLRPVSSAAAVADYFAKGTYAASPGRAAYELTGSQSKRQGKGGRTPFEVLRDLVAGVDTATGEVVGDLSQSIDQDRAVWREWEDASKGRRQMTWSHGLRQLLADLGAVDEVEKTDEQLAEETPEDSVCVARIDAESWKAGRFWMVLPGLLEAAEAGRVKDFIAARLAHRAMLVRLRETVGRSG
ncbi:hypothetical protein [Nocardioides sp. HB32]